MLAILFQYVGYPISIYWFSCSQRFLNYLFFQSFDYERTWLRLSQTHAIHYERTWLRLSQTHAIHYERTWLRLSQTHAIHFKVDSYVCMLILVLHVLSTHLFLCWYWCSMYCQLICFRWCQFPLIGDRICCVVVSSVVDRGFESLLCQIKDWYVLLRC